MLRKKKLLNNYHSEVLFKILKFMDGGKWTEIEKKKFSSTPDN